MTEITREHTEWAVVDRLRTILNESEHTPFNVTHAYGSCVAILAWVMQRVRTPQHLAVTSEDKAAIAVKRSLEEQKVEMAPWALETRIQTESKSPHGDFKDFTAFAFLKWLRDAMCHGDARQVSPLNSEGKLLGFEIRAAARNDRERSLVLNEGDLRRIGNTLAEMYCEALQFAASSLSISFVEDARSLREKRRNAA